MKTSLDSRLLLSIVALTSLGLLACSGEDQDDLDAILRDGDLTLLSRHALTLESPGEADGGVGGVGGGSGGRGTGGRMAAGGFTGSTGGRTGAGGSVGPIGGGSGQVDGGVGGGAPFDGGMGTGGFPFDGGMGTGGFPVDGGMGGFDGGPGGTGGQFPEEAKGLWTFDDCNPDRTDLGDSNFFGHTAYRSVGVGCVEALQGQGIAIDGADDYVYVPDQPDFTFDNGVTAAAWVKPNRLGDVRTIFRKREGGTSTFVLLSNGRDYQFVIRLANGKAADVKARATLNTWTHVAGTYDGRDLRLYINGVLAAESRVKGRLSAGAGPLLMGNDAFGRRIDGALDNVFFDTVAATAAQIGKLNCLSRPVTLIASPMAGPAVPAGTAVSYDVQITNNDTPSCEPKPFGFQAFSQSRGIFVNPSFEFLSIAPGASAHVAVSVTSSLDIEPDDHPIDIAVFAEAPPFDSASQTVTYSVLGTPCSVRSRKELMIRDVSVVDDPVRTAPGGAWTFGRLMENLAPTAAAAPDMVEALLNTWLTNQTVNGLTIPARPSIQNLVLSSFPRRADGKLDLTRAPLRLLSIVNRIDLRNLAQGDAGEGRFVFGVLDPFGNPLEFTMIFEYKIPATTEQDVLDSANRWHALSALPLPSEQFNAALQALTERFTNRGAAPGRVNGSALAQFRTNEIALSFEWQFREFHLMAATGLLQPATVALTPALSFNNTPTLVDYINANQADIIAQQHVVPLLFAGQPFLTGSVTNNLGGWNAPGVNPEARQKFSINTCNGCHSLRETNTFFLQIGTRSPGQESFLSGFLTGTQVFDGLGGVIRSFNDLGRRNRDLHQLICPNDPLPPPPPDTTPIGGRGGGRGGATGSGGIGAGGVTGRGGAPGPGMGTGGTVGTGGRSGGGTGGASGSASVVGTGRAPAGTPVIDESAVSTTRPDFVAKGINRVH